MALVYIGYYIVFIYVYIKQKRPQQQTNVPPSQAIFMAMQMRWSNTRSIAQCSMSKAILDATGRHHWATTQSVLPQQLPGLQANKLRWKHTPTLLAISMAMAVLQYITTHIAWWRRSRALLEATGRHNWASVMINNTNGTYLRQFLTIFFIINMLKTGEKQTDVPK